MFDFKIEKTANGVASVLRDSDETGAIKYVIRFADGSVKSKAQSATARDMIKPAQIFPSMF